MQRLGVLVRGLAPTTFRFETLCGQHGGIDLSLKVLRLHARRNRLLARLRRGQVTRHCADGNVAAEKPENLQPALDLVWITDPDWRSILSIVDCWCVDGGVPPVVLIEGADVVIDIGGASPSPILELVDALDGRAWVGVVEPDGGAADLDLPRWDWFSDKGWFAR